MAGCKDISVCVWTYNHKNYIQECLNSILKQKTEYTYEVIVADDYSTDGTSEIVADFGKKYPEHIIVLKSEKNLGAGLNSLRVLDACTGKYIAFCDGDDYWVSSNKLQQQVEFLEAHKDYYLTAGKTVAEIDGKLTKWNFRQRYGKKGQDVTDYIEQPFFHTSSICCRNRFKQWEDAGYLTIVQGDKFVVLMESTPECNRIKCFNEVFNIYRKHGGGLTASTSNKDPIKTIASLVKILDIFNNHNNLYYNEVVEYKKKEQTVLLTIATEPLKLSKLLLILSNLGIVLHYLLRKLF